MDSYPKISIVTCTYNSQRFLEKSLKSVEEQTYPNIEHIFNDSFSTDSTLEMIADYKRRNSSRYPIKVIKTEPKGVANALNQATPFATGDVIHYLHSDDYYLGPDSLQRAARYFSENPEIVWITGNFVVEIKGRRITIPQTHLLRIDPEKALSAMNIISHENTFVSRQAVVDYGGFSERKDEVVEYRLWLHLIRDHTPLILNDAFTAFIIHGGSTSTGSVLKFSKAIIRAFRTQKSEKIIPLIGHYEDKEFYLLYQGMVERAEELLTVLEERIYWDR